MPVPLELTFREMDPSPAVEQVIRAWADRLERSFDRVIRCAVSIAVPHRHHERGRTFEVHIELVVPDRVIVVSRDPGRNHDHENVYVAITDAFLAARRQLTEYSQTHRKGLRRPVHASARVA
ncbi:MAG: HPF/RaiA family ribosome-associated protein [Kofleriaceae bacterium]